MIDPTQIELTDEQIKTIYEKVLTDKNACVFMLRNILVTIQTILESVENDTLSPAEAMAALMTAYNPTMKE